MNTTLDLDSLTVLDDLKQANAAFAQRYPGESGKRQPVHTVYGGAHLFKAATTERLGELGLRAMRHYGSNFALFARAIGLRGAERLPTDHEAIARLEDALQADAEQVRKADPAAWLAYTVWQRVVRKLESEPVEDFRVDFEDGFGNRPDDEEDATAVEAARQMAQGLADGTLPPFIGIRIKTFTQALHTRAVRTLDLFLTTLLEQTGGQLPDNFVVTLPKVTMPEQVTALVRVLEELESGLGLAGETLQLEIMIETTQAMFDYDGRFNLPRLLDAAEGRCVAAHFGTYDYTASCNITAAYQTMDHAACDQARQLMQIAYAGTGIWLSDGATNVMPVGPHRRGDAGDGDGGSLTDAQLAENRRVVHDAWRLHVDHIRHSLENAYYQGWDLHPAQLPTRYAAVFSFFLEGLPAATRRLKNFLDKAAQATLVGDVFDDAATGQGLLNFFLRGITCGALTEDEALAAGVTVEELQGRSFLKILENRRGE